MKKKTKVILLFLLIGLVLSTIIYISSDYLADKRKMEEMQEAARVYYNDKLTRFEEENATLLPGEIDVVFIGDSLTDGCNLSLYYPEYKTLNRGIGGDTTFGLEQRLETSLFAVQPKAVVMLIGANNFSTMFENYEDILISIKQNLPETHVILVSLTSMGGEWGKNNHLAAYNNVKIEALAKKYSFEFVDVYTPLLNFETDEIYPEYTTDGGHLTHEGYLVLTSEIKRCLDGIFSK